jgi:hypothetical protein
MDNGVDVDVENVSVPSIGAGGRPAGAIASD